jgi:molybdopterin-binding protein
MRGVTTSGAAELGTGCATRQNPAGALLGEAQAIELSARNVLPETVRKIEMGGVSAEVTLEVAPSIITAESVKNLKLVQGGNAYAVIKASSVMVAID